MSKINGKRIQIAGSAKPIVDIHQLKLAHSIVYEIINVILSEGGGLVITLGSEPEKDGTPLIFDWTIIEAIKSYINQHKALKWEKYFSNPIMGVVYSNFEEKIPARRKHLWNFLTKSEYFGLIKLASIKSFGGNLRKQQSILGDVLIILGGSKGVYDLAKLHSQNNKLVIPINIDLKDNGTKAIIDEIQKDPLTFYPEENAYNINSLLNSYQLDKDKIDSKKIIDVIITIINSIKIIPFHREKEVIIYNMLSESALIKIMIELMAELQRQNKTIHKQEDKYSIWLSTLLNIRLKQYGYRTDMHSLSGKTNKLDNKNPELGGIGELDIRFLNKDGELTHICEALILDSLRKEYVSTHLKKIFEYDANGLPVNFMVIYSKAVNFSSLWQKYTKFVNDFDFKYMLNSEGFEDLSEAYSKYLSIKIGLTSHNREGRICKLYHFFLDFY